MGCLDRVTDRNQHLDHRYVVVTADIGDSCFLQIGHATLRGCQGTAIVARCAASANSTHAQVRKKSRPPWGHGGRDARSEEHTSELQSLMRISSAVFC